MECEENGAVVAAVAGPRGVKRKRGVGGAGCVQLERTPEVPRAAGRRPAPAPPVPARPLATPRPLPASPVFPLPFLNVNLMEEITFWVCTRRAPCLYGYNNVYKKKVEEAHCSKYRNSSEPSFVDEVPSPKKRKKKLRLLEDESASSEKQQNVYFERSHKQYQKSWYSSDQSESNGSDEDFNIRNNCFRNKSKGLRSQRKNRSTSHKKSKVITSTPKPTTLRRSLRKTPQNNHTQIDSSFEIFNSNGVNNGEQGPLRKDNNDEEEKNGDGNHTSNSKRGEVLKEQLKNEIIPNGQFEDMSDVSGFTANYIRSTKINSKTPRKIRGKPGRNLARDSQQQLQKDESKIIVCVNKSVNTGLPTPLLNQSTDSSQNVINLVSVNNNNNENSHKVNQSTSQLKFMDSKTEHIKESEKNDAQNNSFQSKSSGVSRYPTRHRSNSKVIAQDLENNHNISTPIKKKISRGMRELRSINQNEQPICLISRTRSGKKIGVIQMDLDETGCSKGLTDNLVEKMSSSAINNVAGSAHKSLEKKKRVASTKCASRVKKSDNRERTTDIQKDCESDSMKKNIGDSASSLSPEKSVGRRTVDKRQSMRSQKSLRDKSGFAACFSDSEEDQPLIRRKFFC